MSLPVTPTKSLINEPNAIERVKSESGKSRKTRRRLIQSADLTALMISPPITPNLNRRRNRRLINSLSLSTETGVNNESTSPSAVLSRDSFRKSYSVGSDKSKELPKLEKLATASSVLQIRERVKSLVDQRRRSHSDYLKELPTSVERPLNFAKATSHKSINNASGLSSPLARSAASSVSQVLTFEDDEIEENASSDLTSNTAHSKPVPTTPTKTTAWVPSTPPSGSKRKTLHQSDVAVRNMTQLGQSATNSALTSLDDDDRVFDLSSDDTDADDDDVVDDIVLQLPVHGGKMIDVHANNEQLEPLSLPELDALRTRAATFFETHLARRGDRPPPLDNVPVTLGHFAPFTRRVLLRIIGYAAPEAVVTLSGACRWFYRACHSFVRAKYCSAFKLKPKTRFDNRYFKLTLEHEIVQQSTLNDFKFLKTLGTGSFGRVRLVQSKKTGQYYAMKMLKKAMLLEYEQHDRLFWEKDIVTTMNHPFIVKFHRTFQDSIFVYFLFEYAAGGEIFQLLCDYGRLQEPVVKFYASETLLVLQYFESLGVIYRDIKPENLLLSSDGHLRFTDFGFAAVLPKGQKSKAFLASAEYVAPEMILGQGYDQSVDMWSFGILLFELLCGLPPFVGSLDEISYKIFNEKIDFPNDINPKAKDLIEKLLVLNPEERLTASQAMQHPWFDEIDWRLVYLQTDPAPFQPNIKNKGDTSHFQDIYPEEDPSQLEELDVHFDEF